MSFDQLYTSLPGSFLIFLQIMAKSWKPQHIITILLKLKEIHSGMNMAWVNVLKNKQWMKHSFWSSGWYVTTLICLKNYQICLLVLILITSLRLRPVLWSELNISRIIFQLSALALTIAKVVYQLAKSTQDLPTYPWARSDERGGVCSIWSIVNMDKSTGSKTPYFTNEGKL